MTDRTPFTALSAAPVPELEAALVPQWGGVGPSEALSTTRVFQNALFNSVNHRMIFVTGGAFTEKAQQFLSETSKEHIEKPFHAANLRAIVQRYLRS